jgi:hypothetical protein
MGLIIENNEQYYAGSQMFEMQGDQPGFQMTTTFNTDLIFGSHDPSTASYGLNNFKLYKVASTSLANSEYVLPYTVNNNTITIAEDLDGGTRFVVQLKSLRGGNYGNRDAYGNAVENNYGSYSYITLDDVINNFMVAYVGDDKLIPSVKRTDVVFHAKRGIQEFSYDVLKSIKSQELTVPLNLSIVLPQDYVNYVRISCIDESGVKKPIYPSNNLTIKPISNPLQDGEGLLMQDTFSNNIELNSITEDRWDNQSTESNPDTYSTRISTELGKRYGSDPQHAQSNGWFTMNEREGKISFSSDLADQIIVLEYISDGLAYDMDTKVPKMAEEALYAHISSAIVSSRINQPEYIVRRLRQERSAKMRNAKIRLSNIKLSEITQVLRGKSKLIK